MDTSHIMMPWDRYKAALQRFRTFVADGRPLITDDSDEMGDKHTHCSWGLCEEGEQFGKESWPEPNDHLWPVEFMKHGRVAPRYLQNEQWCPMDRRSDMAPEQLKKQDGLSGFGCFYHCRIFKPKGPVPDRAEAVRLYDVQIERVRQRR